MALKPDDSVHKILLSTPSRFTDEYIGSDFVVTHAWPGYASSGRLARFDGSPLSRNFFVIAFQTEPLEEAPGFVIPNYEPTGEFVAAMMALLYGKRFDAHGALEMTGHFHVPDLYSTNEPCEPSIPFHSQSMRADYPVPLVLSELRRFHQIFEGSTTEPKVFAAFHTASLFYVRAMRVAASAPEVAYLHLITAGERIADTIDFDKNASLDSTTRNALRRIETELVGGEKIASLFHGRLRQLKRRYCHALCSSTDDGFFERRESDDVWGALTSEGLLKAVAAAYDLRSRYVHTGASFGSWIGPRRRNEERQTGKPYIPSDKGMARILYHAPTLVGLERLTRVALLRTAERLGATLPSPGSEGASDPPGAAQGSGS